MEFNWQQVLEARSKKQSIAEGPVQNYWQAGSLSSGRRPGYGAGIPLGFPAGW